MNWRSIIILRKKGRREGRKKEGKKQASQAKKKEKFLSYVEYASVKTHIPCVRAERKLCAKKGLKGEGKTKYKWESRGRLLEAM